ncbi:nucleotide exchange factor GrpE [Dietzia psychralcaliphila]|uniref:Protein GrpE n=1 Tax=Dietzia psychralcaliphila TaxID=139021 RepID=A0AAD0JW92_9ACTN|nr:nucleotide exchange factor GrpE [Dietzia psychralcaliphila]AWH96601.1 nucleotide exchange factor GrpE [Dietzia psychralcaliphila]PTM89195.1 molecular chaperone GrpE [Dietzia psychralcaliphila]
MTTPHADGPETDKAAWAGGDAEDVAAAQAVDEKAGAAPAETVEGEIVDDDSAAATAGAATTGDPSSDDTTSALQAQLDERTADLQRVSAEFANYRRRVERDRQAIIDTAKGSVLTELLTIVDDLERARAHGDLEEGPLKVFADRVHAVLASQGVESFGEEGDAFDPAVHEAVQDESEGSEPVLGTILRKGYRHGERTLRSAMVTVR